VGPAQGVKRGWKGAGWSDSKQLERLALAAILPHKAKNVVQSWLLFDLALGPTAVPCCTTVLLVWLQLRALQTTTVLYAVLRYHKSQLRTADINPFSFNKTTRQGHFDHQCHHQRRTISDDQDQVKEMPWIGNATTHDVRYSGRTAVLCQRLNYRAFMKPTTNLPIWDRHKYDCATELITFITQILHGASEHLAFKAFAVLGTPPHVEHARMVIILGLFSVPLGKINSGVNLPLYRPGLTTWRSVVKFLLDFQTTPSRFDILKKQPNDAFKT